MDRNFTLKLFTLMLALSASFSAPAAFAENGFQLDLDEINRTIDESDDIGPPQDEFGRSVTLEEAIKIALEHNLSLQISTLDVEAQRPEISDSKSQFHPVAGMSFTAGGSETTEAGSTIPDFEDSLNGEVSVSQEVPTGGSVSVKTGLGRLVSGGKAVHDSLFTVTATQPLLRGGRIYVARQNILNAEYDHEILKAQLHAQILGVIRETKSAYYEAILTTNLMEVTSAALVRDRELLEASNALFLAGRVNKRDVFSAEIKLAKDQVSLAKNRGDVEQAQNELRDVLGLPIDMQIEVTDKTVPFLPVEIRLAEWIRSAITNRPEILEKRIELDRKDLEVKVLRNSVLPSLDFVGSYSRSQGDRVDVSSSLDLNDDSWSAGLNFSIPFGNVSSRSKLAAAKTQRATIERQYVQLERTIEKQVRGFEITLRRNIAELKATTKGLEHARAKREIASVRFQLGLADNFDITDADEDLIAAETDLLSAITEYANNLAAIEAAIVRPL